MTARQRTGAAPLVSPLGPAFPNGPAGPLGWEDWFARASTQQQDEVLDLARQQGLLYVHQIPPLKPAPKSSAPRPDSSRLTRLLAGDLSLLDSLPPRNRCPDCPTLDPAQREAVARALDTPDLFLLEGVPGSGKTRVVAEIVRQACRRGLRLLFLAHLPCSLDAALVQLAADPEVFALRYLASEETAALLPAPVQGLIPSQRAQAFSEQLAAIAKQFSACLDEHSGDWQRQSAAWERLRPHAAQLLECDRRLQQCQADEDSLPASVRADAARAGETPFHRTLSEMREGRDERRRQTAQRRAEVETRRTQAQAARADSQTQLDELRPLAESRRAGRWWTWTWWKALRRGKALETFEELQAQAAQRQAEAADAERDIQAIAEQERQADTVFNDATETLIQREIERRRHELARERRAWTDRRAPLQGEWQEGLAGLSGADRAALSEPTSFEAAFARWQSRADAARRQRELKLRWARYLEESAADFLQRLPGLANLVAAPVDALPPGQADTHFDLLILEDAQRLTEADLLRLGRLASRCVLVADHDPDAPAAGLEASATNAPRSRAGCFQKLWQHLHHDDASSPYRWMREGDRLCCQLRPLSPQHKAALEVEHLVDFPEVELRIASTPTPALVQILFPAGMDIAQAKQFIYRELQEVPCRRLGASAWLAENEQRVVCHLAAQANGCAPIELEKGLWEWSSEHATCRLEFDKANGWTRGDVEAWIRQKFGLRDLGRTLSLSVCHRAHPALGALLADVFFPERLLPVAAATPNMISGGFVFIPIPMPTRENGRKIERARGRPATPWPREGAGLEIDLAALRAPDRIPNELRALLPRKGFANYFEAQAVVEYLERLLGDASSTPTDLAVLALYEGQVELIRILIERSEALKERKIPVGLPEAFRQKEFSTVLLSMTRSHSHRAVTFGESPSDLPLAFTRACEQVILFADPGNLIKRAAWQGPLEHLAAAAAAQESRHIVPLVRYLQAQGRHQDYFRVETP